MVTAILTAGGNGTRMQNEIPKQFMTVNEIPIIIYTLQQFQKSKYIDQIVIACLRDWQPILRAYSKEFNISKLAQIVDGGNTGIQSIQNCFKSLSEMDDSDIVLIHDGNRPLVDNDIIKRNIDAVKSRGATTSYIDIHDGIVRVDELLKVQRSDFKREDIKSTQTPHCFNYGVIKDIFSKMEDFERYISIADAAIKLGYDIALVKGSEINFKITTPTDLVLFDAILSKRLGNV